MEKYPKAREIVKAFCAQAIANGKCSLYRAICTCDIPLLNETLSSLKGESRVHLSKVYLSRNVLSPSFKRPMMLAEEMTALHLTAYQGKSTLAKVLLEKSGAIVNAHSLIYTLSPLMLAVSKSHHEMMRLLICHGADVNDNTGRQVAFLLNEATEISLCCISLVIQKFLFSSHWMYA